MPPMGRDQLLRRKVWSKSPCVALNGCGAVALPRLERNLRASSHPLFRFQVSQDFIPSPPHSPLVSSWFRVVTLFRAQSSIFVAARCIRSSSRQRGPLRGIGEGPPPSSSASRNFREEPKITGVDDLSSIFVGVSLLCMVDEISTIWSNR